MSSIDAQDILDLTNNYAFIYLGETREALKLVIDSLKNLNIIKEFGINIVADYSAADGLVEGPEVNGDFDGSGY